MFDSLGRWVEIIRPVASVAQLDRASDFGSEGWGFESLRAHGSRHSALGTRRSAYCGLGELASRLYYDDSYSTEFFGTVTEATEVLGRPAVVLRETVFYPSSGGQPHDTGWLGDRRVLEVLVREADGAVVHVLDGAIGVGTEVAGRVDWGRRFDHMQQHSGQHILSQSFIRIAGAPTVGFHLGAEYVSIDLETAGIDEERQRAAVTLANDVIERDLPIRAWFPSAEELPGLSLRKTPDVDGALRVVAIGDFDVSACGGTHVARTGQIGLVHGLKTERYKRGLRISFLCGGRARRDYAMKQRIVSEVSGALTCAVTELPETVQRLQNELQEARRESARHHEAGLDREASELRTSATLMGGQRVIRQGLDRRSVEDLKGLGLRLTSEPGTIALLGTGGDRAQFVMARSEDLTIDLRPALQAALTAVGGGKGGGTRIVQGGGGVDVSPESVSLALEVAVAALALG